MSYLLDISSRQETVSWLPYLEVHQHRPTTTTFSAQKEVGDTNEEDPQATAQPITNNSDEYLVTAVDNIDILLDIEDVLPGDDACSLREQIIFRLSLSVICLMRRAFIKHLCAS